MKIYVRASSSDFYVQDKEFMIDAGSIVRFRYRLADISKTSDSYFKQLIHDVRDMFDVGDDSTIEQFIREEDDTEDPHIVYAKWILDLEDSDYYYDYKPEYHSTLYYLVYGTPESVW